MIRPSHWVSLSIVSILIFSGCNDGKLTTIEYNNSVVDILNNTSTAIQETTNLYETAIPNIVSEDSKIDIAPLKTAGQTAQEKFDASKQVLELKSRNAEQETAVKLEFITYTELGETYMATYNEMIRYYENPDFAKNLDSVETYDEKLHKQYNDFIESNNKLVDILAQFVE